MSFSKIQTSFAEAKCEQTQAQFSMPSLKIDLLSPLIEQVKAAFPTSNEILEKVIQYGSLMAIAIKNIHDPSTVALCCANLASSLGLAGAVGSFLTGMFTKIYNLIQSGIHERHNRGYTEAQSDDDEHADLFKHFREFNIQGVLSYIGGIGFALLTVLVMRKLPGKKTVDEIMSRIKHLPGTVKSASEIQEFGTKMCDSVIWGFKKHVLGYTEEQYDIFNSVKQWQEDVQELMKLENTVRIRTEAAYQYKADAVYQRGLLIAQEYDVLRYPMRKQETFRTYMVAASRIRDMAHNSGAGYMKPRINPLVMQLFGTSGVGKSVITNAICADLLRRRGFFTAEDYNSKVYLRKVDQIFWDGMTVAHLLCIYDDWCQKKDVQGDPNPELLELIYACNNAPYNLHMADLASKATTFFNAEGVILTSNLPWYEMNSITYPEAIRRRIDIRARVHIKPEFGKLVTSGPDKGFYRLDPSKLVDGMGFVEPYLFDIVCKDDQSNPPTQWSHLSMSYEEFIKKVLKLDIENMERNKKLLQNISDYISRPVDTSFPTTTAQADDEMPWLNLRRQIYIKPRVNGARRRNGEFEERRDMNGRVYLYSANGELQRATMSIEELRFMQRYHGAKVTFLFDDFFVSWQTNSELHDACMRGERVCGRSLVFADSERRYVTVERVLLTNRIFQGRMYRLMEKPLWTSMLTKNMIRICQLQWRKNV